MKEPQTQSSLDGTPPGGKILASDTDPIREIAERIASLKPSEAKDLSSYLREKEIKSEAPSENYYG